MELTYFADEVNSVKWRSGTARLYLFGNLPAFPSFIGADIYNVRAYIIYREFQFGIYGEGYVIYQDCWQTKAGVLVFSLEQSSIEGFFEDSTVYEYTPDFEFDKKKAYYNARRNFSEPGNSV